MRQILRIFGVVGIVLLTALISAGSCDKKEAGNKVDTNIEVTPETGVAVVSGSKISILATKFPTAVAGDATADMANIIKGPAANTALAFKVSFKGATDGGMMFALDGDKTDINKLTTPALGAFSAGYNQGLTVATDAFGAGVGSLPRGYNIVGAFGNKTANNYAYTVAADTQPVLWCVANLFVVNFATGTGKLTGGRAANCHIASRGTKEFGTKANSDAWLGAANVKKSIKVSFAGIDTGESTIDKLGLGDAAATAAAFTGGLSAENMAKIIEAVGAGKTALSQYDIEIVSELPAAN